MFDVKNQVVLITGASGGLGKAAAFGMAKAGAKVMLTGRTEDKLKTIVDEINDHGGTAYYAVGRPDDEKEVAHVVDETIRQFHEVNVLITAAGVNRVHPITEFPTDAWEEVMDVNVKGTWLACREVGRAMISQGKGGKVVLVSSTRGELGMANYSAYSPSKAAINLMTKSLACEWGTHGINVNAIAPTVFRTELTQWMFDDQETYKKFLTRIPLGRLGEPEDLVGPLIFLSSRASDFVTGAVLYADGGYAAG